MLKIIWLFFSFSKFTKPRRSSLAFFPKIFFSFQFNSIIQHQVDDKLWVDDKNTIFMFLNVYSYHKNLRWKKQINIHSISDMSLHNEKTSYVSMSHIISKKVNQTISPEMKHPTTTIAMSVPAGIELFFCTKLSSPEFKTHLFSFQFSESW